MNGFSIAFILFLIMDPLGHISAYLNLVKGLSRERQRWVLLREMGIALLTMLLFSFLGEYLFAALEISESMTSITLTAIRLPTVWAELVGTSFTKSIWRLFVVLVFAKAWIAIVGQWNSVVRSRSAVSPTTNATTRHSTTALQYATWSATTWSARPSASTLAEHFGARAMFGNDPTDGLALSRCELQSLNHLVG